MDEIEILAKPAKFKVMPAEDSVKCSLTKKLTLFGEDHIFNATGEAHRTEGNIFNITFGKAFAFIRATRKIDEQIEMCMLKYSFTHMLEKPIWNAELIGTVNDISGKAKEEEPAFLKLFTNLLKEELSGHTTIK